MMNVIELKPKPDAFDLAKALRNIADDIEAGAYSFDPNMAVVVLATEIRQHDREGVSEGFNWQTHGLGEKCGYFACKGVLASALARFECGEDA